MIVRLLLLFLLVPFVELVLLLYISEQTSPLFTLGLVILTGILGTLLARSQGWRVWSQMREDVSSGRLPTTSLLDAVLVLLAGAFLLTPGVLTDLFGFSLMIPWTRHWYRERLLRWIRRRFRIEPVGPPGGYERQPAADVIDSYTVDPPSDARPSEDS